MDTNDEHTDEPRGWIEDIPFEADEMLPLHRIRYISELPPDERAAAEAQVPANRHKARLAGASHEADAAADCAD